MNKRSIRREEAKIAWRKGKHKRKKKLSFTEFWRKKKDKPEKVI